MFPWEDKAEVDDNDFATDFSSMYYVRLVVSDEVGTLSKITNMLAKNNISIKTILQKPFENGAEIMIVTSETKESVIKKALSDVEQLASVNAVASLIRVEE